MEFKRYSKHIFIGLLIIISYLSWRIIKPYNTAIFSAFILAYIFYPLYQWLNGKVKKEYISALMIVLMILLIAAVPVALILISAVNEVDDTIDFLQNEFNTDNLLDISCEGIESRMCNLYSRLEKMIPGFDFTDFIISSVKTLKNYAINWLSVLSTGILQFFIALYIVFFLFIDGERLVLKIKSILLLKKSYEENIIKTLQETTHAVIFGNIITAFVQGIVAALGYWLIGGLNNVIILGVATAFFALIPFFGSAVVWFPASIYLMISGIINSSGSTIFRAIALCIFGILVVSTIDNLLKPKIIGDRANIHPVVVLIGVLGGVSFLGVIGIIIGPVILALLIQFIKLIEEEKQNL